MSLLQVRGLCKNFGALTATHQVDLNVNPGEIHAIIGPNGAGKTTLLAQLAGELSPDSGQILFAGRDITRLPAHRRSHIGVARSFQITSMFAELSLQANVALAVQAHQGHSFRFWQATDQDERLQQPARILLKRLGLAERAHIPAGQASHGEHRQLEIAMALAAEPQLLLLDEPMAGMGIEESQHLLHLLQQLRGQHAILLIEHDMDVVFALADRISVLVYGQIIATGDPEYIRSDPEVRNAYLGEL